jgi:hypothetical protein
MKRRTFILGGLGALGMMAGGGALFVNRPEFGRPPQGARLARMEASPHYMNGQFQNLVPVQVMNEDNGENRLIATATKELLNLTDTYVIEVVHPQDALSALMLVLAIDAEKCSRK